MSEFLGFFDAKQIGWRDGRAVWNTNAILRYKSDELGATIHIPAEFVTDAASTPRALMTWLIAGGRGFRSAVIHDWAYMRGSWLLEGHGENAVDKTTVDRTFYESLLADPISGAGSAIAWQMWMAVRMGGRGVWSNRMRSAHLNPIWTAQGWPVLV